MRNVLGRLLILVVEILDRNLLMVPEIDEHGPPSAVFHVQAPAGRNEMTCRTNRFSKSR